MADAAVYNAVFEENARLQAELHEKQKDIGPSILQERPWEGRFFWTIPLIKNPTGCLCVYDDDSSGRLVCGKCCLWTVPAGTTRLQFQVWGPGSTNTGGQCCGGTPFGATGAYITTILEYPTAGDQYTLCAGCAINCTPQYSQAFASTGSPSWVKGGTTHNIVCVCAEGGFPRFTCGLCVYRENSYCCRLNTKCCTLTSYGPCICRDGHNFCFSNSWCTMGALDHGRSVNYEGRSNTGHCNGICNQWWQLSSYYNLRMCFNCCFEGYMIHGPTIGVCHQPQGCTCMTFCRGTCCGGCNCSAEQGFRRFPGAGGTAIAINRPGCCCCMCGDKGRAGMVRVSWC